MVGRIFISFLLLLVVAVNVQAATRYIQISVEPEEVYLGDYLSVHIESTGLSEDIDLAPFSRLGNFVRETLGTRLSVIDGRVVDVRVQRLVYEPQETGTLVIGPLQSGDVYSNSVLAKVLPKVADDWQAGPDSVRLNVELSQGHPYRHAETVLDIELSYRHRLIDLEYQPPTIEGATSIVLANEIRPPTGDPDWSRVVWRMALFSDDEAMVNVGPVAVSGTLVRRSHDRDSFQLISEPLKVAARKLPEFEHWWLPATAVDVAESWSKPVTALSAGDELERTITVTAKGVRAGQIADIKMLDTTGLKIYPLQPVRKNQLTHTGVVGTAEFTFRLVALSPIPVFLDAIRIHWWNTETDTAAQTLLPPRRVHIGIPDRDALLKVVGSEQSLLSRMLASLQNWWNILVLLAALLNSIALWKLGFFTWFATDLKPIARRALLVRRISRLTRTQQHAEALRLLYGLNRAQPEFPIAMKVKQELEDVLFTPN